MNQEQISKLEELRTLYEELQKCLERGFLMNENSYYNSIQQLYFSKLDELKINQRKAELYFQTKS